ncbi:hypothetical protein NDR87_33920 [Nocardia sp. CDC159]|uniref:SRPBCC family protein n=1 Tax=Nocardia pulmonis TaxID=2951408 RepID=A0A9X2J1V9_9NOCA|nr:MULTISPECIES: hypothetical protein [Nocardia]MCM6778495.1 hypothetical protein [Nocardia pulmonis]MCM6791384.1 hypothetical protein [Nocardia sp. CDC159]
MERLSYIDRHSRIAATNRERVWDALWRGLGAAAERDGGTFDITEKDEPRRLVLEGSHRFSRYALIITLEQPAAEHTLISAETRADFPGIGGWIYRKLVIDSGGHGIIVRAILRRIVRAAERRGRTLPGQVWGARPAELDLELPCDADFPDAATVCDRALSIAAPPELVYAWLCQLRVAPYSYDLLDNFGRRSPRRRCPELTELAVGQRFMGQFRLTSFAPAQHITLHASIVAVTYAVRAEAGGTRLHVRARFPGPPALLAPLVFGDFLMMRKQLRTLKELAESEA